MAKILFCLSGEMSPNLVTLVNSADFRLLQIQRKQQTSQAAAIIILVGHQKLLFCHFTAFITSFDLSPSHTHIKRERERLSVWCDGTRINIECLVRVSVCKLQREELDS